MFAVHKYPQCNLYCLGVDTRLFFLNCLGVDARPFFE
jgi:hypothetical protein